MKRDARIQRLYHDPGIVRGILTAGGITVDALAVAGADSLDLREIEAAVYGPTDRSRRSASSKRR